MTQVSPRELADDIEELLQFGDVGLYEFIEYQSDDVDSTDEEKIATAVAALSLLQGRLSLEMLRIDWPATDRGRVDDSYQPTSSDWQIGRDGKSILSIQLK